MTAAPHGSWDVAVVIPARNEAVTIRRCIDSVLAACDVSMRCLKAWVVVVADSCSDRTAELAWRSLASHGEVLQCAVGSPGTARRLGAATALRHFGDANPQRLWLANTDADTHVPLDWIDTHLRHADTDAEAVAGIVRLDPFDLRVDVKALYERTYRLASEEAHEHVHGANLGVRADAYLDAGGWSDVAVAEDHCLWGRLMRRGWRLSSPVTSVVHTSGRLQGRATGGFADALRRELLSGD
jgi:cellulose synthase/poly-beta-1,6-N-acetylglucosamine synthase-like glycosyltransferase